MALRKNLMLFEFIATIAAGFGMAGIALIITHLSKLAGKKAPRWLIPLFGAIGIFGFQISQEYSWFEQQTAQLPNGVHVVKKVEQSTWFRPWSYIKPQTFRFMAADSGHAIGKGVFQPQVQRIGPDPGLAVGVDGEGGFHRFIIACSLAEFNNAALLIFNDES